MIQDQDLMITFKNDDDCKLKLINGKVRVTIEVEIENKSVTKRTYKIEASSIKQAIKMFDEEKDENGGSLDHDEEDLSWQDDEEWGSAIISNVEVLSEDGQLVEDLSPLPGQLDLFGGIVA